MGNGRSFDRAVAANGAERPPPQPEAPAVPPQPVPTAFTVVQAQAPDGNLLVIVQAQTPVGTAVYFLDAEVAATIGQRLIAAGKASGSGLVVPG